MEGEKLVRRRVTTQLDPSRHISDSSSDFIFRESTARQNRHSDNHLENRCLLLSMEAGASVSLDGDGKEGHPWPYLDSVFRYKSRHSNSAKFICLLCAPLHKEVSSYFNSPSNLRKHIEVLF